VPDQNSNEPVVGAQDLTVDPRAISARQERPSLVMSRGGPSLFERRQLAEAVAELLGSCRKRAVVLACGRWQRRCAAAVGRSARHAGAYRSLLSLSGSERIRLPVAANTALRTAGAATLMVGSPTPPQKLPEGITIASTLG
jgi:hypothetical protein